MPILPANWPDLEYLSNGEPAISLVFNRPHFNISTRTNSLRVLLESVEDEVIDARGTYPTLVERLDDMFGDGFSDRNIRIVGDDIAWNSSTQIFTFDQLTLVQPDKTFNYIINAGTVTSLADGDCIYVTLSRSAGAATLTFSKAADGSVPEGKDILVIACRVGSQLWVRGAGDLDNGESRPIGDGMTDVVLNRLGMTHDNDTDSHFTNTTVVSGSYDIPEAISSLDLNSEHLIEDRNSLFVSSANVSWDAGGDQLTWDAAMVIRVPNIGDVTINAGSLSSLTANKVVYFTLDRAQVGGYTASLTSVANGSLPLSNGNIDNLVIGFRYGTKFVFRTGDVLQDGETKQIGLGGGGLKVDQDRSMFYSSDTDVTWDSSSGHISGSGSILIHFPWTSDNKVNEIPPSEFPIVLSASGKKAYVTLDRENDGTVGVIDDVDYVPITYSSPDKLLIAQRVGDAVYIFGQRWNDQDRKRIGEGFVAGDIYDAWYEVSTGGGEAAITLPGSQEYVQDKKTLQVECNGVTLEIDQDYTESSTTDVTATVCEMFPDGKFPYRARMHFRIESIVTGGAGAGSIGGGSESTTVSNIGSGSGVYKEIVGTDIHLKSLKGVGNIQITENANEIEIDALTSGETNTASNVGTGFGVYKQKAGVDLEFYKLLAGSNINITQVSNDLVIAATGEANTADNVGTGAIVYKEKAGVELRFKTLKEGSNITITTGSDEITIAAAAGSGETNTITNVGGGAEVYKEKVGVDLKLKTLVEGANITITTGSDTVTIASAAGSGETNTITNVGGGAEVYKEKIGVDLKLKTLVEGDNITITTGSDTITITSGVGVEEVVELGAGATIAARVAAAPVGGIPSGWSVVDATDGSVDAELSGGVNDIVFIHGLSKLSILESVVRSDTFGGFLNVDFSSSGVVKNNTSKTQTRITNFNTGVNATDTSVTFLKLY